MSQVNLRVNTEGVAQGLEGTGGLFVDNDEKKPKQFPMDALGRGERRLGFY